MIGLRKFHKHGIHHKFQFNLKENEIYIDPNYKPSLENDDGFHFLANGQGNYDKLCGSIWAVIEPLDGIILLNNEAKCKSFKIIEITDNPKELYDKYFKNILFDEMSAYGWLRFIEQRLDFEHLIHKTVAYAYDYCINYSRRRLHEAEKYISKNDYLWKIYSKHLLNDTNKWERTPRKILK